MSTEETESEEVEVQLVEKPEPTEYARRISITIPSKLAEKVEDYADEQDIKRSQVIRRACELFFEQGGEVDLSSEKIHEKLDQILDKLEVQKEEEAVKKKEEEEEKLIPPSKEIELEDVEQLIAESTPPLRKYLGIGNLFDEEYFVEMVKLNNALGNEAWSDEALRRLRDHIYEKIEDEDERKELIERFAGYIQVDVSRFYKEKKEEEEEEE